MFKSLIFSITLKKVFQSIEIQRIDSAS